MKQLKPGIETDKGFVFGKIKLNVYTNLVIVIDEDRQKITIGLTDRNDDRTVNARVSDLSITTTYEKFFGIQKLFVDSHTLLRGGEAKKKNALRYIKLGYSRFALWRNKKGRTVTLGLVPGSGRNIKKQLERYGTHFQLTCDELAKVICLCCDVEEFLGSAKHHPRTGLEKLLKVSSFYRAKYRPCSLSCCGGTLVNRVGRDIVREKE